MNEPSIFTRIINGDIPCHKVFEDEQIIAFLDVNPMHDGHTLVVPKKQINHIWDLPEDLYIHLWETCRTVTHALQATFSPKRVGVLVDGSDVPHTHVHLIPFNEGMIRKQNAASEPDHEKLAKIAADIRENL